MITVYTTKTCANCAMVKKYLSAKKLEYKEVDITEDNTLREKLEKMTGVTRVPVVTKGEDFVVGFQPSLLAKLAS